MLQSPSEIKNFKIFVRNLQPKFSHIYIEKEALEYPLSNVILTNFSNSSVIKINHYKDFFNRPGQDFQSQKQSMNLILAKKSPPFLYPVSEMVQGYQIPGFFYITPMLNCLYNCDYCFLQGMYSSGNMIVFVNQIDLQKAINEEIAKNKTSDSSITISVSYNTDLLAMEHLIPLTKSWIKFASKSKRLAIEIRTKSANFKPIENLSSNENVILSWTISPEIVCKSYEHLAPPLAKRIAAIKSALNEGWKVRLCIDPIMDIENWENIYNDFFSFLFKNLDRYKIFDLTLGTFRMNKDYFKRIRKRNPKSDIYYSNFSIEGKTVALPKEDRKYMIGKLKKELCKYIDYEKILVWE